MPSAYEWSKWRWKGKNSVTKRKIFIFQVRDNTKLFTFLFWIFLSSKSNVILGSKGMFLHVVWSLKQIWVNENTMMFPHTSFSMPGNCVSASLLQVVKSFKTIYSICSSSTNYISANLASLWPWEQAMLWPFSLVIQLTPLETQTNAVRQKPGYAWPLNKFIVFMYAVGFSSFRNNVCWKSRSMPYSRSVPGVNGH